MKFDSRLPEYFRLKEVPWQLFATLGFRSQESAFSFRRVMLSAWLRAIAKPQRVHFKKLLFVSRLENGMSGEHWHLHVLVGGLGHLPPGFCGCADMLWKKRGGGFARITHFDPLRDGVGYVLKVPAGNSRPYRLRDEKLVTPTLSDSVMAYLRHRIP